MMTTNTRAPGSRGQGPREQGTGQSGMAGASGAALARGGSALAASVLFLLGVYHFFTGIAAFARDNFYNVGGNYPYQVSNTAWGWWHVVGGVLLAITAIGLFSRRSTWARWIAIVLVAYSVILNFFFLPYFPLWAIVMIPLGIFTIWALVRDGSEQRQQEMRQQEMMMGPRTTAGAFGAPSGQQQAEPRREPAGAGTYTSAQTGQRWPENVGGRERDQQQPAGERRSWPSDVKESAGKMGEQAQERAQSGARQGAQSQGAQSGRNAAEQAAERARQSADRDYRSGR